MDYSNISVCFYIPLYKDVKSPITLLILPKNGPNSFLKPASSCFPPKSHETKVSFFYQFAKFSTILSNFQHMTRPQPLAFQPRLSTPKSYKLETFFQIRRFAIVFEINRIQCTQPTQNQQAYQQTKRYGACSKKDFSRAELMTTLKNALIDTFNASTYFLK